MSHMIQNERSFKNDISEDFLLEQVEHFDNDTSVEEHSKIAEAYMGKWKRIMSVSKIIRCILLFATISFTAYILIASYISHTAWTQICIFTLISFFSSVFFSGVLILILKPLFYFLRKKAYKYHQKITEEEEFVYFKELTDIESYEHPYSSGVTEQDDKIRYLADKHKKAITEITESSINLRLWEMEKAKFDEWLWVIHAGEVILCAVLVIAVVFVVAWFMFKIIAIIYGMDGNERKYYRESHYDQTDKPSFFRLITSHWHKRVEYSKEIKMLKTRLAKNFSLKEDVLLQLEVHSITPPEILYAPYFEKYIKEGRAL